MSLTYVTDVINILEGKMKVQIDKGHNNIIKEATKQMDNKLEMKISNMAKHTNNEIESCKRTLGYHEGQIQKKISSEDLKPINSTIKETRNGLEKDMEGIMEHIRKYEEYGRRINTLEGLTKNIPASGSLPKGNPKTKSGEESEDYNAEVSIKSKIVENSIQNLKASFEVLKAEMENKVNV